MPNQVPLHLGPNAVIPTGNEWFSLPAIRAADGAILNFNVLSKRDRGLLAVMGRTPETPLLAPFASVNGTRVPLRGLAWELDGWWVPTGRLKARDVEFALTYCAPPGERGAFVRILVRNRGARAAKVAVGFDVDWHHLTRVIYAPSNLDGRKLAADAPWVEGATAFSFRTHDTYFTWALLSPGAKRRAAKSAGAGGLRGRHETTLAVPAGGTAEALFFLGVGVEEFSGSHNAKLLHQLVLRHSSDGVLASVAAWHEARAGSTGRADLDLLLNRNLMFNRHYAWGKTLDTEELVGVTARSHRYYVSAAWWDRDSLLWSFPALLHTDPAFAKEALTHALTTQLANVGEHSRFIDGTILEGGFQLDEGVAPPIALASYVEHTGDVAFLRAHAVTVDRLRQVLLSRFDPATGMFHSLQDSQDEYTPEPFGTYMNGLTWVALKSLAALYRRLSRPGDAADALRRAAAMRAAVLRRCAATPPGGKAPILARATDGRKPRFDDVPPGSLVRLASLGFIDEDDPLFKRTYDWLHSPAYKYANHGKRFGLPGSFRVPMTCCWAVADHLRLKRAKAEALRILLGATWDDGIISEGVDPGTGRMQAGGGAFATAAGYVATAILEVCGRT